MAGLTEDVGPVSMLELGASDSLPLGGGGSSARCSRRGDGALSLDAAKAVAAQPSFDFSNMSLLVVPCFHLSISSAVRWVRLAFHRAEASPSRGVGFGLGPRLGIEIPFADRFVAHAFGEALFVTVPAQVSIESANALCAPVDRAGFFGAGLSFRFN